MSYSYQQLIHWAESRLFGRNLLKNGKSLTARELERIYGEKIWCPITMRQLSLEDPDTVTKLELFRVAMIDLIRPKLGMVKENTRLVSLPIAAYRALYNHNLDMGQPFCPNSTNDYLNIAYAIQKLIFHGLKDKQFDAPLQITWQNVAQYELPESNDLDRRNLSLCTIDGLYCLDGLSHLGVQNNRVRVAQCNLFEDIFQIVTGVHKIGHCIGDRRFNPAGMLLKRLPRFINVIYFNHTTR